MARRKSNKIEYVDPGYLYLMSNPAFRYIKLGRCRDWPSKRAKTLSRVCSSPFNFKVERAWRTDNECAAEYEAKQILQQYWVAREFYDMPVELAASMIETQINNIEPFDEDTARHDYFKDICEVNLGPVDLW